MEFISLLCDPVIVLAEGSVLTQGPAPVVQTDERVIECYLSAAERPGEGSVHEPARG